MDRGIALQMGECAVRSLVDEADQLRQGYVRYFSSQSGHLSSPPDWHRNPFTCQRTPKTEH